LCKKDRSPRNVVEAGSDRGGGTMRGVNRVWRGRFADDAGKGRV